MGNADTRRPLLERWAGHSARHPWRVLLTWVGILAVFLGIAAAFGGEFVDNFEIPGTESQRAIDLLEDTFATEAGGTSNIVIRAPGGIDHSAVTERLQAMYDEVRQVDKVVRVETHFENPHFVAPGGTIARAEVRWAGDAGDVGRATLEDYFAILDATASDDLIIQTGGIVVSFNERMLPGSEALGLVAAIIILLVAFGSVVAAGLPIGTAIFGLGAGFGTILLAANTGFFPTFAPQFAAMIGIGVGIDYSLLIVTRYREGLHSGMTVHDAIVQAVGTAGRSVIFAGVVVSVSFLGLAFMGVPFIFSLGLSGAIVVAFAVLVAITLLPALLALAGKRVDRLRIPLPAAREGIDTNSIWYRLARNIQHRPLPYFVASLGFVLLLSSPILDLELGITDDGNKDESFRSRRAYDMLAEGFGPGFNSPIVVVLNGPNAADNAERAFAAVSSHPNVVAVSSPIGNGSGETVVMTAVPGTRPQAGETTNLVSDLRKDILPAAGIDSQVNYYLTGNAPAFVDIGSRLQSRLPYLFAGVIGISFVLLTMVFRSVVVAAKAAVLNLLSISAAFGVLVAVFQWGWLSGLIGISEGPIETFAPVMLFAVLFGLSMDYEVFLISRIREEYVRTGSNAAAVANGLTATARVITAAALIMVSVFFSFVMGHERVIKLFGLGLGMAILVDASVIRLILVPSAMELMGKINWWMPRWLDRLLPRVNLEGSVAPPTPEPVAAGGE
jgi:putative drug exporter of the RND superfamily